MDKNISNNGHPYVDLGLPSGTLWTTMNVGASKPSDFGLYFQWGDTQGYDKDYIEKSHKTKNFSWNDYKWYNGSTFTKYAEEGDVLDLEDDAAHVNMGGEWHMPSPEQIKELLDNATTTWTTLDGVNGMTFTSKKDGSKSIFIPAIGGAYEGTVFNSNRNGYVWSSMLSTDFVDNGQYLYLNSEDTGLYEDNRCSGCCVRGVIG